MGDKPQVMVVDDDRDVLLLLETVLGPDHQIASHRDGNDAWQALDQSTEPPDLVICDLSMPRMGGDELVGRMREDARLANVPVILLTGHDSSEARLGMLEAGVSEYVLKPFKPTELRLRVRNILRDAALLREIELARSETEEVNRELREINAELDRFASAAAHDLQAPLANIAGYAHLLSDGVVTEPEKQSMLLGSIAENANRAIVLVHELLNHARTVVSSDEVDVIDLDRVVATACEHRETVMEESGASVETAGSLAYVSGRRVAVESLMLNLLSNAVKYRSPDRSPVIELATSPADDPRFVEVMVRDNGRGIPVRERERVFGLGTQGSDPESGTGIGLATVRAVVSRHGGSISLEDSPSPGGLTVRFTLPAA